MVGFEHVNDGGDNVLNIALNTFRVNNKGARMTSNNYLLGIWTTSQVSIKTNLISNQGRYTPRYSIAVFPKGDIYKETKGDVNFK